MYTHHNLIVLFVLNLSFISILPPSVPRSVKPESERNMNLSGYAYFNIMHISSPDVIFANFCTLATMTSLIVGQVWYRGADKFLARPGRKQARKHVRDASDFSNIETRAVIKFFFSARQGAEGNLRHCDENISLFPSWSGKGLISIPVYQG